MDLDLYNFLINFKLQKYERTGCGIVKKAIKKTYKNTDNELMKEHYE